MAIRGVYNLYTQFVIRFNMVKRIQISLPATLSSFSESASNSELLFFISIFGTEFSSIQLVNGFVRVFRH